MTTVYTPSLRLALPQQGTLDGMWGTVVNNGITALADAAIAGTAAIAMSDADRTLTAANEAADEARSMALRITGTLTAQRAVICPAVSKLYLVENATTGGHGVNVRTPSGAGTVVAPGTRVFLYCNGVAVVPATSVDLTATQNSTPQWLTGVTGTNAITGSLTPAITAYVAGQTFRFTAAGANTGAATININGLGVRNITREGTIALVAGDIPAGAVCEIVFDGTQFQLQALSRVTNATSAPGASAFTLRNKIINGAMMIDQRNNGALQTAFGYGLDRWSNWTNGTGVVHTQRVVGAPPGFSHSLQQTVNTASGAPAAGHIYQVIQLIEGLNSASFEFGHATAKTVTLSFWVRSSVPGLYALSLMNGPHDRSFVATYTISTANVWQRVAISIPGDVTGTWATDTSAGVVLGFDLGSGSSFNTATPNTWVAGQSRRTAACVNWVNNAGATFNLTGVQLEEGPAATPFEHRPAGLELSLCQRYFEVVPVQRPTGITFNNGDTRSSSIYFKQPKRANPTISPAEILISIIIFGPGTQVGTNLNGSLTNWFVTTGSVTGTHMNNVAAIFASIGNPPMATWGDIKSHTITASSEL